MMQTLVGAKTNRINPWRIGLWAGVTALIVALCCTVVYGGVVVFTMTPVETVWYQYISALMFLVVSFGSVIGGIFALVEYAPDVADWYRRKMTDYDKIED